VSPTSYIADFDSAAAMLRALANYLHGQDFPLLGTMPKSRAPAMKLLAGIVNHTPDFVKEQVYIWSGRFEAIAPRKLRQAKTECVPIVQTFKSFQPPLVRLRNKLSTVNISTKRD
jgi:hypothetical protein